MLLRSKKMPNDPTDLFGFKKTLKAASRQNRGMRFLAVYIGLAVFVAILGVISLAPQLGNRLGTLSVKKQSQQSEAATTTNNTINRTGDLTRLEGLQIAVSTNFPSYYIYEKIVLKATNQTNSNITLPNSAPWTVEKWDGTRWTPIFKPVILQVITTLNIGQTKEWIWNQKTNQGQNAGAGKYRINFPYAGTPYIKEFDITSKIGSEGFFTFSIVSQTLRVYMTNPQSVRDAIDNYYKLNKQNIPGGLLVDNRPRKSPYDPQWSWHMKPDSIKMAEAAMEACDGLPSFVENNLDYWTTLGTYCPWSAQIKSLK